jgi:hypothetical protein
MSVLLIRIGLSQDWTTESTTTMPGRSLFSSLVSHNGSPEEQLSCGQCTAKKNPEVSCYCKVKKYVAENSINGMSRRGALSCGNSAVGSCRPAGPRTASRCNTGDGIVGIKF